jgi:catechol-2,3-dioxygenase
MLCDCHVYPTLAAKDLNRARQFYEQVMGFEPGIQMPDGILYNARESRFLLYPSQYAGTNQSTYMAFEVDDLAKTMSELRSRGVKFLEYDMPQFKTQNGIAHTNDGDGAWLTDTEGNIISLFQPVHKVAWPREMVSAGSNR